MNIRIEGKDTLLTIKHGRIEDENSDVIVSWMNRDMRSGPNSFYRIHQKAGIQLFNAVLSYELGIVGGVTECACFTTQPGQLECGTVFHVIMPEIKTLYARAFYNISETLREHSDRNMCSTVSIYLVEEVELCLASIKDFLMDCGLKEITILYLTDAEKERIINFYKPFEKKYNKKERLDILLEKIMYVFGAKRRVPEFVERLFDSTKRNGYGKGKKDDSRPGAELRDKGD